MIEAATDAVCCHRTETRTNIDEMKIIARAIWETGLEGNGLTSRSLPSLSSSSCQPGKVASKSKQMNAKMIAMMLVSGQFRLNVERGYSLHQVWKYNHIFELTCEPNQIQRILCQGDLVCKCSSIVTAQPRSPVRVDADSEVSNSTL